MKFLIWSFLKTYALLSNDFNEYVFKPKVYQMSKALLIVNFIFQRIFRINSQAGFIVHYTSKYIHPEKIQMSKDMITLTSFSISSHCYIQATNGIKIGRNFLFAPGLNIISANHSTDLDRSDVPAPPIEIGDDVWAGVNVTILPGVKIANRVSIGAGSVVTKSFLNEGSVIAGNPARLLRVGVLK